MPKLLVIVGSTRPGRAGLPVSKWFIERAQRHGQFEVEVVDLAELNLPFLDEPNHPRFHTYVHEHTQKWSATVDSADAVVFVTPEYNFSFPATIKNAIDFLFQEWQYKPVGFVGYGGIAAGTRAIQQLKLVVTALNMFAINAAVMIPFFGKLLDDGVFEATDIINESADVMLTELRRVADAMAPLRTVA